MELLVPGTPVQVWQAIATGPGMTSWFTPAQVDERLGGAIVFDFGDQNCGDDSSSGKVTAWDLLARNAFRHLAWRASSNAYTKMGKSVN
jgi:uncharacterized protein YndB with AHSA1/START domain